MPNRLISWRSAAALVAISILTACGQTDDLPPAKTNRVVVSYEAATTPAHQQIRDLLEQRQTLEKLQELLSPYRLSWPLYLSLTTCDGEADAFYGDDRINICYEYVEALWRGMPKEATAAGIQPVDTVVGPFVDTVLHEFAHALFDYLDVPVLGREEDAADLVSAYIYLQMGKHEARRLIMGTVYNYQQQVKGSPSPSMAEFASEHSTPEQRAFNLLCIAYGADPATFADVAKMGELPAERMASCQEEYELLDLAYAALIGPHVDPSLSEKIFDRSWLPERTSRMLQRGLD